MPTFSSSKDLTTRKIKKENTKNQQSTEGYTQKYIHTANICQIRVAHTYARCAFKRSLTHTYTWALRQHTHTTIYFDRYCVYDTVTESHVSYTCIRMPCHCHSHASHYIAVMLYNLAFMETTRYNMTQQINFTCTRRSDKKRMYKMNEKNTFLGLFAFSKAKKRHYFLFYNSERL